MLGLSLHFHAGERYNISVLFLSYSQHCGIPKGELYWLDFLRLRRFLPRNISKFSKRTFLPIFCPPPSQEGSTLFHLTKTKQVQNTYLMYVLAFPSGKTYGCFFRKTCPTRLQGMISRLPPHIHTRKEISTRKAASAFCLSVLEHAGSWCYLSLHPLPH